MSIIVLTSKYIYMWRFALEKRDNSAVRVCLRRVTGHVNIVKSMGVIPDGNAPVKTLLWHCLHTCFTVQLGLELQFIFHEDSRFDFLNILKEIRYYYRKAETPWLWSYIRNGFSPKGYTSITEL